MTIIPFHVCTRMITFLLYLFKKQTKSNSRFFKFHEMYFTSFINKTKKNFLVVEIFDEWLCHYTSI